MEAPRFTKLNFSGCDVMVESRLPQSAQEDLRGKSHLLQLQGDFSSWVGGGQAVLHNSNTKTNFGTSDPRKDGAAIPQPDPHF